MKKKANLIPLIITVMFLSVNFSSDIDLIISYKKLDANQISTYFRNNGTFNRNFETGTAGFELSPNTGYFLRYGSNLVLGAITGQDTIISAEGSFQPGYIDENGVPHGRNDPAYRVYKIVQGDTTGIDYTQWPGYQGAYVHSSGKPYLIGKQTLFSSYTDGYTDSNSRIHLKAQVLETDWAFDVPGPLGNAVFSEFRIINRSANVWNDFHAGIFTDDDIIENYDDLTEPDSSRNIAYTYNAVNYSGNYGAYPPVVSFNVLSGSVLFTGNPEDSIVIYRPVTSGNRIVRHGYRDLLLTSFNPFLNSNPVISTPSNEREYYNVLSGLKKDGSAWINPNTNQPTKFPAVNFGAGDYKFLIGSGPVNVNPGDTQTFIVAQLVARGVNVLSSITSLKAGSEFITNIFGENFYTVSVNEPPGIVSLPDNYKLYQNYPNPFNPETRIRYSLPVQAKVKLTVYDIRGKEITTLVNGLQNAGEKEVTFKAGDLSSGIYFYKLSVNNLSAVMKMVLQK